MAFSELVKFHQNQEETIKALYKLGMTANEIADLQWSQLKGTCFKLTRTFGRVGKGITMEVFVRLPADLGRELRRVFYRRNSSPAVPSKTFTESADRVKFVFYASLPGRHNLTGMKLQPQQVADICTGVEILDESDRSKKVYEISTEVLTKKLM